MHLVFSGADPTLLRSLALFSLDTFLLFFILKFLLLDLLDILLSHVLFVMHSVEEDTALLELPLHIVPVYEHEMPKQLVLILVYFSRHWEDQAQRDKQRT